MGDETGLSGDDHYRWAIAASAGTKMAAGGMNRQCPSRPCTRRRWSILYICFGMGMVIQPLGKRCRSAKDRADAYQEAAAQGGQEGQEGRGPLAKLNRVCSENLLNEKGAWEEGQPSANAPAGIWAMLKSDLQIYIYISSLKMFDRWNSHLTLSTTTQ